MSLGLALTGLAMTGYAVFMPTKANAATLTFEPTGELQAMTNDSVEFILKLTPNSLSVVKLLGLNFTQDNGELSNPTAGSTIALNSTITAEQVIGSRTYNVLTPVKGGGGDVFATVSYEESGPSGTTTVNSFINGADIVPVPEPLTIFGTATALGCGALFKRKSSKKIVS